MKTYLPDGVTVYCNPSKRNFVNFWYTEYYYKKRYGNSRRSALLRRTAKLLEDFLKNVYPNLTVNFTHDSITVWGEVEKSVFASMMESEFKGWTNEKYRKDTTKDVVSAVDSFEKSVSLV